MEAKKNRDDGTRPGQVPLQADRLRRARPRALLLHGWDGARDEMHGPMREAAALGFDCLAYDLRGHGATRAQRATVTPRRSLDDALAAYDAHAGDGPVALVGTSFGGWLAAVLTGLRPVRWLALRVPALYPDAWWDTPKEAFDRDALARYREQGPSAADDRALAACAAFDGDVLLVWSGRDERLSRCVVDSYQLAFARAASVTLRCLPDADHGLTDPRQQDRYRQLLGDWLGEMLRHPQGAGDDAG